MSDAASLRVVTAEPAGKIEWYVERRGAGPDIVLIPSGEGDCGSFGRVADELSEDFLVTTFDTPGFSRTEAKGDVEISMVALSRQIALLIKALGLWRPTVYGCSSAGLAALDLAVDHQELIGRVVVHEVALPRQIDDPRLIEIASLDDRSISKACAELFEGRMNEDPTAWQALGPVFHDRLSRNYPKWIRNYVAGRKHPPLDPALLACAPITWTIGGLSEAQAFFTNVRLTCQAGLALELLPCRHFPQVSIPGILAGHIRAAAVQIPSAGTTSSAGP